MHGRPGPAVAAGEARGLVALAPPVGVRALFRRFWPLARPLRGRIVLALLFVALAPAAETATIWVYKLAVDNVLVPHDAGALPWVAALYVTFTLVSVAASFADDYTTGWVGGRLLLSVRARVFEHLQSLPPDFFERRRLGDLVARLTGDVAAIETLVLSAMTDALSYVVRIAFFTSALVYLEPRLAAAALVVAPLFWIASRRFSRRIKHASRDKRRRVGAISAVGEESLANAGLVQAYTREEAEAQRFATETHGAFAAEMRVTGLRAGYSGVVQLIEMLGALLVIGLGTHELAAGRISLGGLLAFLAYLTQLYSPVRRLSRLANTVFAASASAERIVELLDERAGVSDPPRPAELDRARGAVTLREVGFAYPGTTHRALRDVSLAIAPGQTVAFVGPSGAGKSTVAKLLLRFYDPSAGAIELDGHDVRDLRLRDLRRNVAVVLQETMIFDGTIAENIAYGRAGATREDVEAAARAADADTFIAALPAGYDTLVGQRGRRLSGGQRQRIAIARAVIRDAPLLILDEPTTGLDAASRERVLGPLRRLMDGRTTIVVSHDLAAVRGADAIVVLDSGRIRARGRHDTLLRHCPEYARLWELQAAGIAEAA